jgi:hypothetical protein
MKLIRIAQNFYVGAKAGLLNKQTVMILKYKITDAIDVQTQMTYQMSKIEL